MKSKSKHYRLMAGTAIMAIMALTTAQTAIAQSPADDQTGLDVIIVTAQRKSEDLQKVPAAVSAFGSETLYENQIETIGDLQSYVPNLSLHVGDAANAVIYLRGIGQIDSISFNDPGVGVYVDDVYMGRAQGSFLEVMDPERIEVLRGPQGTLYGRNTIGGAVKFVSARPTQDFEGYIDGTYGNYDRRDIKASLSGPLVKDVLAAKIAFADERRDGYTHNLFDGKDDFDKDLTAVRTSVLFTPDNKWSFYLTGDYSKNSPDRSRTPHKETPIFSVVSNSFIPPTNDPFVVDVNFNTLERLRTQGVALTSEYAADSFTVKSITSYREMDFRTKIDLDGTTDSSFGIYDFEDQAQFSQELQLLLNGARYSLVSGLYYFRETDSTLGGAIAPDFFVFLPGGIAFPFPFISGGLRDQTNKSYAAYSQLDYDLMNRLSVTLGARITRESKNVTSAGEQFAGLGISTPEQIEAVFGTGVGFGRTSFTAKKHWSSFSPKFSLNYQINDAVLTYISASRGFKSGGFNGRLTDRAQPFDPEHLWSYETGLKSQFADGKARLNLAAFYNDYTNFQLSRFSADPNTGQFLSIFDNAGKATIYGAEAEFSVALGNALTFNANGGYLHSKYNKLLGDFDVDVSAQRKLVNAPKWTSRGGFTYKARLDNAGDLSFSGAVSYRSRSFLTVSSSPILSQKGYALLEGALQYDSPDGHWSAVLSGKNLTDKAFKEHGFDLSASPGVQLAYYGTPRTYSLSLRYRF